MKTRKRFDSIVMVCAWLVVGAACASEGAPDDGIDAVVKPPVLGGAGTGAPNAGGATPSSGQAGLGSEPAAGSNGGVTPGAGGGPGGALANAGSGAAGTGMNAGGAGGTPSGSGGTPPPQPTGPSGPEDGDPSQPIVAVPGVACGPNPSLFGLTTTNAMIGGRAVHVAYPCNKHKGAPVVFILNLHGTMPDETLKLYQVAYFSANTLADSHNFITASPKSVVAQWGNGDGGVDEPHLMEVIEWVYTQFADFDIRAMWVAGHSWGAMYSTTFACSPALADKVKGVVLQSGTGLNPACADRLSVISTAAESDIGPVINQGGVPASHGCGAEQTNMVGNNVETYWPDCDPGFVHANYFMLGKAHADYIDAEVVKRIGDLIKLARP